MKRFFNRKNLFLLFFLMVSAVIIARVPLHNNKTIFENMFQSVEVKDSEVIPENTIKISEGGVEISTEVWKEIDRITEANRFDSVTMRGKISLYDNLNEQGVNETSGFEIQNAGKCHWMKISGIDKFYLANTCILVDHEEKEILVQQDLSDSLMASIKMLSRKELKKLLKKDGTSAEIAEKGNLRVLIIKPGSLDAVNTYEISYDPATYRIKGLKLSYTSFPYEDYFQGGPEYNSAYKDFNNADTAATGEEDILADLNITEYVIEYQFESVTGSVSFDFISNEMFRVENGEVYFNDSLSAYTVNKF